MRFQVGKYYENTVNGNMLHVAGAIDTEIYGCLMIAEFMDGLIEPVGGTYSDAEGWQELDDIGLWDYKIIQLQKKRL